MFSSLGTIMHRGGYVKQLAQRLDFTDSMSEDEDPSGPASSPGQTRSGRVYKRQLRARRTLRQQAVEEGDVAVCEADEEKAGSEAER